MLDASLVSTSVDEPVDLYHLPGVHKTSYIKLGDINIGALSVTASSSKTPGESCSQEPKGLTYSVENSEAIAFAVDLVNRNPNILPNITLGFVQRGVCGNSPNTALATSTFFLPRSKPSCNDSECHAQRWLPTDFNHDIIGVITPDYDSLTTMISHLYSVAHLPMVGATEITDDLSDKNNHPYFFRIVPPSTYMVKAILEFLYMNRMTYISILYQEGNYGRPNYETVIRSVEDYGICIATSHMLVTDTDYDEVVADLLRYPRARAVILFVVGSVFRKILRGVIDNQAKGHFIFFAGDAATTYSGYRYVGSKDDPSIGTFVFDLYFQYVMDFYNRLKQQRGASSKNPWLKRAFEYIVECSYDKPLSCKSENDLFGRYRYRTNKATNLRVDAVLTFAHAAHNLLTEICPNARGKEARACITGKRLKRYLQNVTFEGYNGRVEFDQNQEVRGKFIISQFVYDYYNYPFAEKTIFRHMNRKNVGVFDSVTQRITFEGEAITWSHMRSQERVVPWTNDSLPFIIPESVCSRPCVLGEYRVQKEVPCCWDCLKCRENERLIKNQTDCEACPPFTWPDPSSGFMTCIDIPPTHPDLEDTISIILNTLAVFCLFVTIIVFTCYVIYGNQRVIKASSKELSVIQMVAILLGYSTVVLFQTPPTDVVCGIIFFMFCMSFAFLYCPLLIKTIRIVRIFKSGARNEKPLFISARSQLVLSVCLIMIQVIICTVTYILFRPGAHRTQPIWSEKLVELSCDLTFGGVVSFLAYNTVLISLCSMFAFMVRNLPDNFNESKFISMCVSTTLLIWLAFVPSYFTAGREYIRGFLLSMALLLNHSVALILLFMPKIYAAIFLPQEGGKVSMNRS